VGIASNRKSAADWDADFILAKSAGIDAFALNIGKDSFNDQQLGYAYESAAKNGVKVFISFDYNYWTAGSEGTIGKTIATYGVKAAQLKIGSKVFVSSFIGRGALNAAALRSAVSGLELYLVPNFWPSDEGYGAVDGAFNWAAWPSDGNNGPPKTGQYVSVNNQDTYYVQQLAGKAYMARTLNPLLSRIVYLHEAR